MFFFGKMNLKKKSSLNGLLRTVFFVSFVAVTGWTAVANSADSDTCAIKETVAIPGENLPNIISITGFETNKYQLSEDCKKKFTEVASKYNTEDLIGVTIIGYASELGSSTTNVQLAQSRATYIKSLLEFDEPIPKVTRTAGESQNNTQTKTSSNNLPSFRSVEVLFSYPKQTDKYRTIVFLKKWQELNQIEDSKCPADTLFKNYITHVREKQNDTDFKEADIEETFQKCLNAGKTNSAETKELKEYKLILDNYKKLSTIHKEFRGKRSVWKDAEGNFNTARLASDGIAAVVLGTVGGLITSNVVKKNQVEDGFEDIKCTIGGQNVAQWGDQFRVGIQ
ncbi:MAG: OmpA family protein [Alphaproteobacteria bacterium]|nr:OmpA family protein [Alphaproteobacteria bacterium]